ncbi:class I SAM-dependent methyltransferase [Streptomyces sp. P38-E01]|uniref:Class I SAM-dependent methyltransferase n=1 Tax=Streptomyces tardus TaxID=2780544 RepID=A0A949NB93_9ACTN|nr:class I SAM-dependent methyltransferase [Streptomyces tardus]MBU7600633.1 class I SAM-dependent methyltransferase [Streptomyces tardus]
MENDLVMNDASGPAFDETQVPLYYSRKTKDILHKYGPGPRVHFHLGLFGKDEAPNTTVAQDVLRRRITDSQERVLTHAAQQWRVDHRPSAEILDIGCGLGGGSIFWAQKHGASVQGLTVAEDHIPVIEDLARRAGVSDRVRARAQDVHELDEESRYDGAVAIESSGYMDRERLFAVAAKALRPGGWFGIQEHFICRPEWTEFIDAYYKTRLGTLTEYIRSARQAGLELEQDEDITDGVAEFWVQSMAWSTAELERAERTGEPSPIKRERLTESALTHGKLFRIWRDHAVETRLLLFRKGS